MRPIDIEKLLYIGISLSKQKDEGQLLDIILNAAMDITGCDAGTLYRNTGNTLEFQMMFTRSAGTKKGGRYGEIALPPVPITSENVCANAVLHNRLINIADVYESREFDFSGPKKYDTLTGYQTTSMLVIPMEDDSGDCIGVLQLINAMDADGQVVAFDKKWEQVIRSIASQTAIRLVSLDYAREVQELLDSIVRMMATAIDARSPYNANHTCNMVKYGEQFIKWLEESDQPWKMTDTEKRQFIMAIRLHDAGKITVPLEVMDKSSRLGSRYPEVENRFRLMKLLARLAHAKGELSAEAYAEREKACENGWGFIAKVNEAPFVEDEMLCGIRALREQSFTDEDGRENPWITEEELTCLSVRKGTLTDEERRIIENHVSMTTKMLKEVRFPKEYKDVPRWAEAHHEFLNGSGYPKGVCAGEIPKEVRLLTILDVFDALTAIDRPYKAALPVEKSLQIMGFMVNEGKLDGDLLKLFAGSKAWEGER